MGPIDIVLSLVLWALIILGIVKLVQKVRTRGSVED
jgi:hypothetical protein